MKLIRKEAPHAQHHRPYFLKARARRRLDTRRLDTKRETPAPSWYETTTGVFVLKEEILMNEQSNDDPTERAWPDYLDIRFYKTGWVFRVGLIALSYNKQGHYKAISIEKITRNYAAHGGMTWTEFRLHRKQLREKTAKAREDAQQKANLISEQRAEWIFRFLNIDVFKIPPDNENPVWTQRNFDRVQKRYIEMYPSESRQQHGELIEERFTATAKLPRLFTLFGSKIWCRLIIHDYEFVLDNTKIVQTVRCPRCGKTQQVIFPPLHLRTNQDGSLS